MSFLQKIMGSTSGNVAEVTSVNRLKADLAQASSPAEVGAVRMFSENDPGGITGTPYIYSPETDDDFRLRVATDLVLDSEVYNYVAQNTKKHIYRNTTMTMGWSAAGLQTNA